MAWSGRNWARLCRDRAGRIAILKEIYGPQKAGAAGFLSLHLAAFLQRSAFDCLGSVGLSQYAAFFLALAWNMCGRRRTLSLHLPLLGTLQLTWVAMPATFLVAIGVCVLTAFLLYRRITAIARLDARCFGSA